jgi:hypothetical protein
MAMATSAHAGAPGLASSSSVPSYAPSSSFAPLLHFSATDGQLLANGKPFRVKGVTWWGAESAHALPGGLELRSLDEIFALLAKYGFNAIKARALRPNRAARPAPRPR